MSFAFYKGILFPTATTKYFNKFFTPRNFSFSEPPTPTVYIGLSPLPVRVTTRIITFLVGDPTLNLHFHYYWEGGQPNGIYI